MNKNFFVNVIKDIIKTHFLDVIMTSMQVSWFKIYLLVQGVGVNEIKKIYFQAILSDLSSVTLKLIESL